MPRANITFQNFASGELSPKLRGRYDIPLYKNGCERLKNFICQTQGPATYRNGFKFVAQTRHNNEAVLFKFVYNDANSYVIEFTAGAIRFFVNEGLLLASSTTNISGITNADPGVVTDTGHSFTTGDELSLSGIVGMEELNGRIVRVGATTVNTYELLNQDGTNLDTTGFGIYSSGGTAGLILSVTNPYSLTEVKELKIAQTGDLVYFVHPSHAPRKLTRVSATSWTFSTYTRTADPFTGAGDYPSVVAIYNQRLYMGATNNDPLKLWGTQSASFDDFTTGTGDTDGFTFTITGENRILNLISNNRFLGVLCSGGNKGAQGNNGGSITPTSIQIDDIDGLGSDSVSPILVENTILFLQQGKRKIRALDYSFNEDGYVPENLNKIADHITEGGLIKMAYQEGSPSVVWAVREDGELIGLTYDKQEAVAGWHRHDTGATDKFKSLATIPRNSDYEQLWVCVERTINGSTVYYVEFMEQNETIPEFVDYFTSDSSQTDDFDLYSQELFEAQKRYFHLDSARTYDGSLVSGTITPGATTGTGITFTASASVFSSSDAGREIWERDGNGRAKIVTYNSGTSVDCDILVDFEGASAIANGRWYLTTDSLSGLSHLEGEVVEIVTDGSLHPTATVTNGEVSLDYQSSIVHVGIGYTGLIITHSIEGGGAAGPSQTKVKNVFKLGMRFLNTLGVSFGTDIYNLEDVQFRNTNSFMNRPPQLFTGDRVIPVDDRWEREKRIYIRQDKPFPCTVEMLVPYLNTSED